MRMDQTQSLETGGRSPEKIKAGDKDAFEIAQDDHDDLSLAIDHQANLAVEFAGLQGYLPRQIVVYDIFRGNGPAVQPFQGFDGLGAQPRCIAEYLIDG